MIILIISSRLVMLFWVSSINKTGLFRFWDWELITRSFWGCLLCYWQLGGREWVIIQVKINLIVNCQFVEIICSFQKNNIFYNAEFFSKLSQSGSAVEILLNSVGPGCNVCGFHGKIWSIAKSEQVGSIGFACFEEPLFDSITKPKINVFLLETEGFFYFLLEIIMLGILLLFLVAFMKYGIHKCFSIIMSWILWSELQLSYLLLLQITAY